MSNLTIEMKAKAKVETSSMSSSSSSTTVNLPSFSPSLNLPVNAMGILSFRFPTPDFQTEIIINRLDGSIAYVSTHDRSWSGDSILPRPKAGSLIQTEYFGLRNPILRLLQTSSIVPDEVQATPRWLLRSARFNIPASAEYEWKYAGEKREDGKVKLIVLRAVDSELSCNGGKLEIDDGALQGLEVNEWVIVATCLVMLKREVDRRRSIQFAMMAGSGGS
ncbi:hypothetical protein N7495_000021 [Penicillium taxi]|uniref:uncharacterized protein n=1 Tax=Penicillium taxi TaxID=168475 RepID=UPI00254575F5|nr:uncharacterized protein N7495_000021 [Penicillium taxi]KAJ5907339.1 hypothetical protein N7495_000021 [Penicillium taxi]